VLSLPDFSQPFHIEIDASGSGVGAVLQQNGHPLAFISKALGPQNLGLSTYEKEYLAIVMAVDQWRYYLLQNEFFIHTDQKKSYPPQRTVFAYTLAATPVHHIVGRTLQACLSQGCRK
jgi:hypothetical protein